MSAADKKDIVKIEDKIGAYCEAPPSDKETKLCYYVDPIKREISQPAKNGVPVNVICQRLKKKSAEICALKYSSAPPAAAIVKGTDLTKLRVKDLKAFLAEKAIACADCIEKEHFVAAVERHFATAEL